MYSLNRILNIAFICIAAFFVGIAIFSSGSLFSNSNVSLYFDNAGKEPMVVAVDGKEEPAIDPGKFIAVSCQAGERRLHVRCGNAVLFDGVKDIQKSDKLLIGSAYLFNPDNRNRYVTYKVVYGSSSRLKDLIAGFIKPDKDIPAGELQNEIRKAYGKLLEQLKPHPITWFEVGSVDHVLTPPPAGVFTRRGDTVTRTVLARIDPKDFALLEAARENRNPSMEDLDALTELVDRVLD
jgi:hypothetical protein